MLDRMEIQFLELKQGNMTVSEYAAKFNELERFAPSQVDTERKRAKRFEQGLKPWLRRRVAVLEVNNFEQLVEKATIAEETSEAVTQFKRNQKKGKFWKGKKGEGNSRGNRSMPTESRGSNITGRKRVNDRK